jgi:hypothetical protein
MKARYGVVWVISAWFVACGGTSPSALDAVYVDVHDLQSVDITIGDVAKPDGTIPVDSTVPEVVDVTEFDAFIHDTVDGESSAPEPDPSETVEPGSDAVDYVESGSEVAADAEVVDGYVSSECVRDAFCADDADCQPGERCNHVLVPPQCYKLYCGNEGESCDPGFDDLLCKPGLHCIHAEIPFCSACAPDCVGRVCGGDGCGGSCGTCAGPQDACVQGACVCQPACEGRSCGADGCGGFCGVCAAGSACNPSGACTLDTDGDGSPDELDDDDDGDGYVDGDDCAPVEPAVHPGAIEVCNALDDDCDGTIDEPGTPDCTTWFADRDQDGVGAPSDSRCQCGPDADGPYTAQTGDDCDDTSEGVHPGAAETCNGRDDTCDGKTDAEDPDLVPAPCEDAVGVCEGAEHPVDDCVDGAWLACSDVVYLVHAPAYQALVETSCDGLDNDCDGEVDDDFSVTGPDGSTYQGVGTPCGVGACTGGSTVCTADQVGVTCGGPAPSTNELCDGLDDDCDGLTDADDPDLALSANVPCESQAGVCQGAVKPASRCSEGGWRPCIEADYQAWSADFQTGVERACDGLDNDCDGAADEDFSVLGADGVVVRGPGVACGVGACAGGVTECTADHLSLVCPTFVAASPETCNGADDDCDGVTDAFDSDLILVPCELQAGVCAGLSKPITSCVGGAWEACGPALYKAHDPAYQAGQETSCDGLDNDCSGQVDEDFSTTGPNGTVYSGVGVACGVGKCAGGQTQCTENQQALSCSTFVTISDEVCNLVDDDCDGKTDAQESADLLAHDAQLCELQDGVCHGASKPAGYCQSGVWKVCDTDVYHAADAAYQAAESTCDGLDNDCDGLVDEAGMAGCDDQNPCTDDTCAGTSGCQHAANLGQCTSGYCEGGACVAWICTPNLPACNGQIATSCNARGNGFVAGGTNCSATGLMCSGGACVCKPACTGKQCGDDGCGGVCGSCSLGSVCSDAGQCIGVDLDGDGDPDAVDCAPNDAAVHHGAPETCNGQDDDCNGETDESHPDLGDVCTEGIGACAVSCTKICDPNAPTGPTICNRVENFPVAEICGNGLDDDCDGQIDEGFYGVSPDDVVLNLIGQLCGVGVCAGGVATCRADNTGLVCSTQTKVSDETCNGKDDDCDGDTDTLDNGMIIPLCESQAGVCAGSRKVVEQCASGSWSACTTTNYRATSEVYQANAETSCDSLDNDCDGFTDEDVAVTAPNGTVYTGVGKSCGVGVCAGGTTACSAAKALTCTTFALAGTEVCNGVDDDCDGTTDASDSTLSRPACEKQSGVCAGSTKPVALCVSGAWGTCVAATYTAYSTSYQATTETTCDGLDNDCDGAKDENWTTTGANGAVYTGSGVSCGVGACAGGTTSCATTTSLTCSTFSKAATEKCANSIDDDCDGTTDETGCTP